MHYDLDVFWVVRASVAEVFANEAKNKAFSEMHL